MGNSILLLSSKEKNKAPWIDLGFELKMDEKWKGYWIDLGFEFKINEN